MPNRLAHETSPYLLQHATNPVDWYPWGEEALKRARTQDKPILLSIGYSACHWCHVMAHESFEDTEVAAVMNELFINIKVDREERPDLDQIYQTAHAMLTRRNGGWPLTMFLLPDQTPFFGGTYFPKTTRYGMPGFIGLLRQVAAAYRAQRVEIDQQSASIRSALAQTLTPSSLPAILSPAPLDRVLRELKRMFDETHGGIGNAPKFPHPVELEFCLRHGTAVRDKYAVDMVKLTLTRMAEGGIYDQLGGGFCRYSVDERWTIPHFEKMLYDNGPLLRLYCDLWLNEREPLYARVVSDTAAWVMREMQSPQGGYYSSLDADSEHEEGKFYVWDAGAVKSLLTAEEYAVVTPHYGLDGAPNFEGHWHLRVMKPLAFVAQRLGLPLKKALALLDSARAKLLGQRAQRVRPGRDDKVLTGWNALMIKAMAHAARVFDEPAWLASARAATEFIRRTLWQNGRLLATAKDGRAHLNAYLDDYAFLLDALLELMQCDFAAADLVWSCELAEVLLDQFEDQQQGGFFFVSHDHEQLIQRSKTGHDNATPAGNGIAALALARLGHLLGEPRYLTAAERTVKAFQGSLEQQASAHASLCMALMEQLTPPTTAILRGAAAELRIWQRALNTHYRPRVMTITLAADVRGLPAALDKPATGANATAWVCQGTSCLPPVADLTELTVLLDAQS